MYNSRRIIAAFAVLAAAMVSMAACTSATPQSPTASPAPDTASTATAPAAATTASEDTAPGDETTIPFTTVDHDAPLGDRPAEATYAVVVSPQGWDELQEQLPDDAVEAGRSAGEDQVIFVAYAGARSSSGYQITITSLQAEGQQLLVTVEEQQPGDDDIVEPAMTLPFHVVSVAPEAIPQGITTVLFQDASGATLQQRPYPQS